MILADLDINLGLPRAPSQPGVIVLNIVDLLAPQVFVLWVKSGSEVYYGEYCLKKQSGLTSNEFTESTLKVRDLQI